MDSGKRKSSAGLIAVLVIIVLALGGYIIYDKVLSSPKDNVVDNNKDNKDNNVVEEKELDLNEYDVVKLYNDVFNRDNTIQDYFHSNLELTNKTVSNEMKLLISYEMNGNSIYKYSKTIENGKNFESIYTADASAVLNQINRIFGSDNGYSHNNQGISGMIGSDCGMVKYNQNQNVYELKTEPGCGGITTYHVVTKLVKAIKTKDSIILTEKSYVTYSDKTITKDLTQNSPVIASNVNPGDEYFDKGSTVTYTFKLSDNGTYYFDNSKITY